MNIIQAKPLTSPSRLAIVRSYFNEEISDALFAGAKERLLKLNLDEQVDVIEVPGAIEIPIVLQRAAKKACYDVLIALGAVIRGETGHYDYVCKQVSDGCQRVALDYIIPVIFGVLTTDNIEQARDRVGGRRGHIGRESVDAAVHMVSVLGQFSE